MLAKKVWLRETRNTDPSSEVKKAIGVLTKAIVLLTKLLRCVCISVSIFLPTELHDHIVSLWWCPQPIVSVMTRCVVHESKILHSCNSSGGKGVC